LKEKLRLCYYYLMRLDADAIETWQNLLGLPVQERASWIKDNLSIIVRTLERSAASWSEVKGQGPRDLIISQCLGAGLYKEAEHVLDTVIKKVRSKTSLTAHLDYYRGIARFLQGRFKDAYEDFKSSRRLEHLQKEFNTDSLKAISYMEETIFPMIEKVARSKEKLRHDLNVARYVDRAVGPNVLKTLHKWNSSSPLYSTGISQGGGYLLTLKNRQGVVRSIAIDPGYGFLELFRDCDLSIVDLDAIIVTHDHDDHTESIEAILSLLAKYNDNVPHDKIKVLDVFGSSGVMLKFQGLFDAVSPLGSKEINFKLLVPNTTIDHAGGVRLRDKYGCVIHVKEAFHEELWTHEESSVGFVIETNIAGKDQRPVKIGVTGDTRYESGLGEQYRGCQILLMNIGSLEKEEGKLLKQHLGLIGSINVIKQAMPEVAVITEFGEEFQDKRATVASVIEEWAAPFNGAYGGKRTKVFPADVRFEIKLEDRSIKETSTGVFLPAGMVEAGESVSETILYQLKESKSPGQMTGARKNLFPC